MIIITISKNWFWTQKYEQTFFNFRYFEITFSPQLSLDFFFYLNFCNECTYPLVFLMLWLSIRASNIHFDRKLTKNVHYECTHKITLIQLLLVRMSGWPLAQLHLLPNLWCNNNTKYLMCSAHAHIERESQGHSFIFRRLGRCKVPIKLTCDWKYGLGLLRFACLFESVV